MSLSVKDTICISLDFTKATCKADCDIKYARKLINNYLKESTAYGGGWTVWFEKEAGGVYYFALTNPFKAIHDGLRYTSH